MLSKPYHRTSHGSHISVHKPNGISSSPEPPHWTVCISPNSNIGGWHQAVRKSCSLHQSTARVATRHTAISCTHNALGLRGKLRFWKTLKPIHCARITHMSVANRKNRIKQQHWATSQGAECGWQPSLEGTEMGRRHLGWGTLNYYGRLCPIFRKLNEYNDILTW